MDANASPTYEALQRRVVELEDELASLKPMMAAFLNVAVQAVRTLGQQRLILQPEGFWLTEGHQKYLRVVKYLAERPSESSVSTGGAAGSWTWHGFERVVNKGYLPKFSTRAWWTKDQVTEYTVVPFQRAFPLELFEAIIRCADTRTISRTARTSLACYHLFMPVILDRPTTLDRKQLKKLLHARVWPQKDPPLSRLVQARSFHHIRRLEIPSHAFPTHTPSWSLDTGRLSPGATTLDLDVLTIVITDQVSDADEQQHVCTLRKGALAVLPHLNPKKLVLEKGFQSTPLAVCQKAGRVMSSWSRLEEVYMDNIYLLVVPDVAVETEDELLLEDEGNGVLFLSERGIGLPSPGKLTAVWDLAAYKRFPFTGYDDPLDMLLHRDDTLRQPWLESFTVVLRTARMVKAFQKLVDASPEDIPSCLRWKVQDTQKPLDDDELDEELESDEQI